MLPRWRNTSPNRTARWTESTRYSDQAFMSSSWGRETLDSLVVAVMSVVLAGRYPFPRRPSGYKREKAVSCTCVHNTATVTVSGGCPPRATRTPYYRCSISQSQNNFPGKINKIPAITGLPQFFATTASSMGPVARLFHDRRPFRATCPRRIGPRDDFEREGHSAPEVRWIEA